MKNSDREAEVSARFGFVDRKLAVKLYSVRKSSIKAAA